MRISDWSSDVCSSDLFRSIPSAMPNLRSYSCRAKSTYATHCFVQFLNLGEAGALDGCGDDLRYAVAAFDGERFVSIDRKSVVLGKGVSVRVDLGGRRLIKKKSQKAYIIQIK